MSCELCGHLNGHASACPYFSPHRTSHYCSICNEGIYEGEEYIVNDDNEYRHLDCFFRLKDLAEWLGYEVKIMEDTYERDY